MSAITSISVSAQRLALVADDEIGIQAIVARVVREFGMVALPVGDGAAAVAAVEAHHGTLACAILDVMMPSMDGVDAAHAIQLIAPNLAIVLMSGVAPNHYADRIKPLRLAGVVHKPFSLATLRELIRTTIGDSAVSEPQ